MCKASEGKAADACCQLVQMKRLGEVIVGAGIEPVDFIGYFATRGQNQYLGLAIGFPKFPEYGHAVDAGKVEVEYHEVEGLNVQ